MGWNSWNHFAGKIDDATIRAQADAMVASGMRDAGYVYVNIDDTWQGTRDTQGRIRPNARFPDMKALADYVHARGLKLGIYSSPGPKTCAGFEGSLGHEEDDARTYAAWGIDYLKYDLCSLPAERKVMREAYAKMDRALRATGRPIIYSLCQYGYDAVWRWGPSVGGNLWRTTGDITDSYARMSAIGFGQAGLARYAGPGHWNDPDMLEVGNGGMTTEEYRTHMTLWAMLAAPLIAGNDLTSMSPDTLALLTNRGVIAIDQDPAGRQADRLFAEGPVEVWTRRLADGSLAVALFNRHDGGTTVELDFAAVGYAKGARVHDAWKDADLGRQRGRIGYDVPAHGARLLRLILSS